MPAAPRSPFKMISGISIRAVKTFPKLEIAAKSGNPAKLWKSLAYREFKKLISNSP
jgi:hypothetical protein